MHSYNYKSSSILILRHKLFLNLRHRVPHLFKLHDHVVNSTSVNEPRASVDIQEDPVIETLDLELIPWPHLQIVLWDFSSLHHVVEPRQPAHLLVLLV